MKREEDNKGKQYVLLLIIKAKVMLKKRRKVNKKIRGEKYSDAYTSEIYVVSLQFYKRIFC